MRASGRRDCKMFLLPIIASYCSCRRQGRLMIFAPTTRLRIDRSGSNQPTIQNAKANGYSTAPISGAESLYDTLIAVVIELDPALIAALQGWRVKLFSAAFTNEGSVSRLFEDTVPVV